MTRFLIILIFVLGTTKLYSGVIIQRIKPESEYAWIDGFHYLLHPSITIKGDLSDIMNLGYLYNYMESKYNYSATLCPASTGQSIKSYDIKGSVKVPDEVSYNGKRYWVNELEYTFYGCREITDITLPETITYIGLSSFYNCSSLQSIKIPILVTKLYGGTFHGCNSLKYIELSPNINKFQGNYGYGVFEDCDNIISILCPIETPPICRDYDFSSKCFKNAVLYVPNKSIAKYKTAEGWKNFFNIKPISDYSKINDIHLDPNLYGINYEEEIEIYNIYGHQVFKGFKSNVDLSPGIYIVRQNNSSDKIRIK